MATAQVTKPASDYDRAVAWQARSIEIAQKDQLVATRDGYGVNCEFFTVPSRSRPHTHHILALYNSAAPKHAGQLYCPCQAQARGLPCGHVGAVLIKLDQERANVAVWTDATAGYQDEL